MTKDKLEARVKELEELLGIKTIPTKMNEIEVLEVYSSGKHAGTSYCSEDAA